MVRGASVAEGPPMSPRGRVFAGVHQTRMYPRSMSRNVVLALAVGILLIVVIVNTTRWRCLVPTDSFDATVWRAADTSDVCSARTGMVDDLTAGQLRVGMDDTEVLALLGVADVRDAEDPEATTWYYRLKCQLDCDYLAIRYDNNGSVVEIYDYQD